MKKAASLLLTVAILLTVASCGSAEKSESQPQIPDQIETIPINADSERSEGTTADSEKVEDPITSPGTFRKEGTIEECVMYEGNGVRLTAKSLNFEKRRAELKVLVENTIDKDRTVISGSIGYSRNFVNGFMINGAYINCDVSAGNSAEEIISFDYDDLMLRGITEIREFALSFYVEDEEGEDHYTDECVVKTSLYTDGKYDESAYQKAISESGMWRSFGYEVLAFSNKEVYDTQGLSVASTAVVKDSDGNESIVLEAVNSIDHALSLKVENIAVNGLTVEDSTWSRDDVSAGKRALVFIHTDRLLDERVANDLGISEIGKIDMGLVTYDDIRRDLNDPVTVTVSVNGAVSDFDKSGKEIYNSNNIIIVAKEFTKSGEDYDDDLYLTIIVENHSDKEIRLDDSYDSLYINTMKADYLFQSVTVAPGSTAYGELRVDKSDSVQSPEDIKKVEFEIEIKDENYHEIDTKKLFIEY